MKVKNNVFEEEMEISKFRSKNEINSNFEKRAEAIQKIKPKVEKDLNKNEVKSQKILARIEPSNLKNLKKIQRFWMIEFYKNISYSEIFLKGIQKCSEEIEVNKQKRLQKKSTN